LGTLRANETIELTATVSEIVTDVHFEDGQRVKAGTILVEMTNEEEHALIEEEQSTVAEAKDNMIGCAPGPARGGIHIAARSAAAGVRNRQGPTPGHRIQAAGPPDHRPVCRRCRPAQYQCGRTHRAG
jgi:multidrug efflux pump subunit AcrA (membrane-fusion protein)